MTTQAFRRLEIALAAPPPGSFDTLSEADLEFLATSLAAGRERQSAGLDEAAENALRLVPALARGPVRRILFR
ncbi:hypothetical protein [Embleya sp. AB8]|uniref:hypothetical protein n=1 Tax=Embleya sp. AB8 TaxID=3156304 RepID=UPI003C77233A